MQGSGVVGGGIAQTRTTSLVFNKAYKGRIFHDRLLPYTLLASNTFLTSLSTWIAYSRLPQWQCYMFKQISETEACGSDLRLSGLRVQKL